MNRWNLLFKKAFTPITIMLIPHSSRKPFSMKVPSIGVLGLVIISATAVISILSTAVDTLEYRNMKEKLNYYSGQFTELKSTIMALKKAESEFKRIFSFGTRTKVLENLDTSNAGDIDIEILRQQIKKTFETVGDIKDYLSQQKDLYMATPKGMPANGRITSAFGRREHPIRGERAFHTGLDIASYPGTPIKATADGIVSFSGWSGGSGNLVVVEHGFGYSTFYAHNKMNSVSVGQPVKRGQTIGYVGSTGNTTGPHVHYEIWKNSKPMDPGILIREGS